ncbi:hypothetical protein RHMOL_Rhmol01G0088900 [Rhododendron molle]|uniref:Uncharacterized protein n=2 Tax=Rhododendron molle TaxID=49168 RepID=A0ACC0Q2S0_RHOML|nr:hypothetical protein RHMOL_Rhmol01G0088900 [Rhododendron molle]KAI8571073.1 hypothetical protein RHMOL_Rhmol01G0088900 [Rhododendron molle]
MYSKSGAIIYAENVFFTSPEKNFVTYTSMILGYGQHGFGKKALSVFYSMKESDVRPDGVTLVAILSACSYSGCVDNGLQIFESMEREYGIRPSCEHHCCVTDMLGRVGRVVEAYEFVKQLGEEGNNFRILGSLLAACRNHGEFELGKSVANKLLQRERGKGLSGYHVLLSNMYAEEGNWEYVNRVRKGMREKGLTKDVGCSWVDVAGCVNSFVCSAIRFCFCFCMGGLSMMQLTSSHEFVENNYWKIRVDNLETSAKESESGMKESQHEAEHKSEILENIAIADSDQSTTGMHDEIQDTKADVSFGQQRESTEREGEDHNPTDNIVGEEQEKTETSTHEEQSRQHHMQKTEGEAPMDSEEIETEGSSKYAETITNIEERRPVGSPEEIVGEKQKDETIIADDINKNEVQEANDLPTIDLDEKTRSAELEIPNKSGKPTATEGELNVEAASTSEIDSNTEKVCELKSEEALKEINAEDNVEEEREQTEDELPHQNLESSFFEKVKGVFFHKVDNLETSAKESEPGMKDFVKESQQEAGHKSEILENIAAADSDLSTTGMHDEIQDTKADVSFGQQRESTEREGEDRTPTNSVAAEEQEKTETSTLEEQSGQSYMQKAERKAPTDSKEIETEGSDKYAETVTNIEEQREVIVGEKPKDWTINTDDIYKNEVQEANDEVSMSESEDPPEAIQFPNKEEKHVNEISEATESLESTISEPTATEGELNVDATSTSDHTI